MAHAKRTQYNVRADYIYQRLPLKEAGQRNGVRYATAQHWKRRDRDDGDDWDAVRAASRLAKGGLAEVSATFVEDFVLLFQATVGELNRQAAEQKINPLEATEALSRLADAYAKTTRAHATANPAMNKLSIAMEIIEQFNTFITANYPQMIQPWAEIIEPFGRHIGKTFG